METTESCKQCEKFGIQLRTEKPILEPLELPNTFHKKTNKYVWKHTDLMAYAMIPRSVKGTTASIDMFLCIDEDILDDIDLAGYTSKFLNDVILPRWKNVKEFQLIEPILGTPDEIPCWKLQHQSLHETTETLAVNQE